MEKERLLIVDSDIACQSLLAQALQNSGFEVQLADSGENALLILSRMTRHFTAVIIGGKMSPMDGIELTEKIKKNPSHVRLPVFMFTSENEQFWLQARTVGVSHVFIKPDMTLLTRVLVSLFKN